MAVVRLPSGGCVLYSPILGPDGTGDSVASDVRSALEREALLPVRVVVAPSPQHHLALGHYQRAFPEVQCIVG